MQERYISKYPVKYRKRMLIIGILLLIFGVLILWLKGTDNIVGRIFCIAGVPMLLFLPIMCCRKVEIVGSCGISKAFLKKRLFYLSEVAGFDYFAGGDSAVAYDAAKTQIFNITRRDGNYTEIINTCHKKSERYVEEPKVEKARHWNRVDTLFRVALYLGITWTIFYTIMEERLYLPYLFAVILIFIVRISIADAVESDEDGALRGHGTCIENAVLSNYLDSSFGRAYPIFEFRYKRGRHLVYGREKMKLQEIQENLGKEYKIIYAPGKASAVKIWEEEFLDII